MAKLVYYSGQVQGVGFRASAAAIARRHAVRGWVRNLADGRVQLFADGSPQAIETFLADIRDRMSEYIRTEDAVERDSEEGLSGFHIAH